MRTVTKPGLQARPCLGMSSRTVFFSLGCTLLLLVLGADELAAHPKDMTLASFQMAQDGIRIETVLPNPFVEAISASENEQSPLDVAASAYRIQSEGGPCPVQGPPRAWRLHDIEARRYVVDYACVSPNPKTVTIEYTLAHRDPEARSGHENLFTLSLPGHTQNEVFSRSHNQIRLSVAEIMLQNGQNLPRTLSETEIATPGALDFLTLGIKHILVGLDHVVFLIALFLVGMSLSALLAVVTAFTVGHSITLGLSTLGIYSPEIWIAESVIAVSIVYLGIENLYALLRRDPKRSEAERKRLTRRRWAVAGLFGLIHGFGFSYVIRDLGLPEDAQVHSLMGFNLGVEIGQLLIVATLVPVLAWLWGKLGQRAVSIPLSLIILALGGFWLVERTVLG